MGELLFGKGVLFHVSGVGYDEIDQGWNGRKMANN